MRAVWSTKMPLASTPAILNLLDGPVGIDPAFHIVWARFRMMRRCLAYCPEQEPGIFRDAGFFYRGAQGHGPVHLLLVSAAELGFCLGWGFSPSSQDDDWSHPAFLFFCSGWLAILYRCQVIRAERLFGC